MITKNSKLILVILAVVFIALLAGIAFIINDIKVKNMEISALLNDVLREDEARSLFQSVRAAQNIAEKELKDFDNLLLTSEKLVFLIEDIEKTGRAFGLDTDILSVGKAEESDQTKPEVVRVEVETQGEWAPTLSFARTIESLPHRVMVDDLNISKLDSGWRLRISLSLYLFN